MFELLRFHFDVWFLFDSGFLFDGQRWLEFVPGFDCLGVLVGKFFLDWRTIQSSRKGLAITQFLDCWVDWVLRHVADPISGSESEAAIAQFELGSMHFRSPVLAGCFPLLGGLHFGSVRHGWK